MLIRAAFVQAVTTPLQSVEEDAMSIVSVYTYQEKLTAQKICHRKKKNAVHVLPVKFILDPGMQYPCCYALKAYPADFRACLSAQLCTR